ncbi:MAG: NAD(P)H-flavin reductase [Lysobacterales bacterium]|jgi:NAD(P)H-flavin reductase
MYKILSKQILNSKTKKIEIQANSLVKNLYPGQCIIIMPQETSTYWPVSTVDVDPIKGTLSVVFQETNLTLKALGSLKIGDEIFVMIGPVARPIETKKYGQVLCVSEDYHIASSLALCRALKNAENKVSGLAGFKTKEDLILETQFRSNCDNVDVVTDDGSYERKGDVALVAADIVESKDVDCVFVFGGITLLKRVKAVLAGKSKNVFMNASCILECGVNVHFESPVRVNGKRFYLGFESLMFEASNLDCDDIEQQLIKLKEYYDCQSLISKQLRRRNESKIFPKLFAGLTKNK